MAKKGNVKEETDFYYEQRIFKKKVVSATLSLLYWVVVTDLLRFLHFFLRGVVAALFDEVALAVVVVVVMGVEAEVVEFPPKASFCAPFVQPQALV